MLAMWMTWKCGCRPSRGLGQVVLDPVAAHHLYRPVVAPDRHGDGHRAPRRRQHLVQAVVEREVLACGGELAERGPVRGLPGPVAPAGGVQRQHRGAGGCGGHAGLFCWSKVGSGRPSWPRPAWPGCRLRVGRPGVAPPASQTGAFRFRGLTAGRLRGRRGSGAQTARKGPGAGRRFRRRRRRP